MGNGALTIGTLDGANIEIRDAVGAENILIFGHTAYEIDALRRARDDPKRWIAKSPELDAVLAEIPKLEGGSPGLFRPLLDELLGRDRFFNCADFAAYVAAQEKASALFGTEAWTRMSIRNVAGMGFFSSDRAIREYAEDIWQVTPVPVRFEGKPGRGMERLLETVVELPPRRVR